MPRSGVVTCVGLSLLACVMTAVVSAQKPGAGAGGGAGAPHAPAAPSPAPRPTSSGTPANNTSIYPYGYGYPPGYSDGVDPDRAALYDRLHRQERQKQVVKDADRLIKLTADYQTEVKATGQTAQTDKHLREIEKLAHEVRTTLTQ